MLSIANHNLIIMHASFVSHFLDGSRMLFLKEPLALTGQGGSSSD